VQRNLLEGGVELDSEPTLLVPVADVGEEPEPEPAESMAPFAPAAPWSAVFTTTLSVVVFPTASFAAMASSATAFTVTASSAAFAAVASSAILALTAFSAVADAANEAYLAVEVHSIPSDPSGAVITTALESGRGAMAASGACCPDSGGPLTTDLSLQNSLILLYRGASSSSDITSVSLSMI
jgi:hypothetical protein